jgi:Ca2+-binding EF-hand superfamily protein
LIGLSVLSRGTLDEKLRWIFNLYDINRDGKVTKDELLLVITSVYELMGSFTEPAIDSNSPKQHVEIVFKVISFFFFKLILLCVHFEFLIIYSIKNRN